MSLTNKIDFAVVFKVKNANPNGDPLNGNRPRITYDRYGEVSDVCLKRKIRDRLLEMGHPIFVQSDDRKVDDANSLKSRAESDKYGLGKDVFKSKDKSETARKACGKWFDVRAFGQVFAFGKGEDASGVSIPIRGPVSIHAAFSIEPVDVTSNQITKSVSGEETKSGKKSSDTMGMKHRVDHGVYVFYGSMNPQLASKTGFSDEDARAIKSVLPKLFENDASSARPEGSMEVLKVVWWQHSCPNGQLSSAKVHRSLNVAPDGVISFDEIENCPKPEVIDGF
jgi:CRISPR-associated protein Csd2